MLSLDEMDGERLNKLSSNAQSPVIDTCCGQAYLNPMSERDMDIDVYTPGDVRFVNNSYEFLTEDGRWVPMDDWWER